MDKWENEKMEKWMDGWMDGWRDQMRSYWGIWNFFKEGMGFFMVYGSVCMLQVVYNNYCLLGMFSFWKKKDKEFNLNNSYLTIQFLTQEQKLSKDKIINQLKTEYADNLDTIVSYSDSFRYSHRYTLFSPNTKNKILMAEVLALIEVSQGVSEFYQDNVEKVILCMKNDKIIKNQDIVQLYNQRDISLYEPCYILQIIYQKKSLLDRLKTKTKKLLKNIPQYIFSLLTRVVTFFLNYIGLGSINSIVSSFIPFKMIISWVLNALMVMFPAFAPLIALSKIFI